MRTCSPAKPRRPSTMMSSETSTSIMVKPVCRGEVSRLEFRLIASVGRVIVRLDLGVGAAAEIEADAPRGDVVVAGHACYERRRCSPQPSIALIAHVLQGAGQ